MLRVKTEQYGDLELSFVHQTGDTGVELRRILASLVKEQDKQNLGFAMDKELLNQIVTADLDFLEMLQATGKVRILVDIGDRMTSARIRATKDNTKNVLDQEDAYFGYSYVNPEDQYNKELGRTESLKRAIQQLPGVTSKTEREIMAGYYQR